MPAPSQPDGAARPEDPADAAALRALQDAVQHVTVATPGAVDHAAFDALVADLARHFPRLHAAAEITRPAGDALLMRCPGGDPEADPVVLMGHLDVVPVNPEDRWAHPPYAGVVADGVIWGRGTLDCKGQVVAICAALERMLAAGQVPGRDVWLSFGGDEEVSGVCAPKAVTALAERGVTPWFVLDEGGAIASQAFPGVARPLAVVGTTEKGTVELTLRTEAHGGHASMPPRHSATGRLARAILRLERHPFPTDLPEPTVRMLQILAPHASGPVRWVAARAGDLRRPLAVTLARLGPETAALTRTTTAVTQLRGSAAANALAATASATVNMRVMVSQTVAEAVERVRRTIADPKVRISVISADEPSPLAPTDDDAFRLIEQVTAEIAPDALTVPYVAMVATDARHFHRVWPRVYRFTPFRMSPAQRASLHNVDEHLEVSAFLEGIRWYRRLLERL